MRILGACSLGGAGHWRPLSDVLLSCQSLGHGVIVVGPAGISDMVRRDGFEFVPGGEPPEEAIAPIREQLRTATRAEASVLGNRELFGRLASNALRPRVEALVDSWAPQIVLRDPCEYASAVAALSRAIPSLQVAISLAEAEWSAIGIASPALEELEPGLSAHVRSSPYITRFPEHLDTSPFPRTIRYRESASAIDVALPDWWAASSLPLVYLTMGTVLGHMTAAADVFRCCLEAVGELPIRVLLTVGKHFDSGLLDDVPANVHVERWIDQQTVVGHSSVVVCHGGSGTVLGAWAAGVPLVVLPSFADQFANAKLVEDNGLGRRVDIPPSDLSTDTERTRASRLLRNAIVEVLTVDSFRQASMKMARRIAATPTVTEALSIHLAVANEAS
jgi:hypothetical protein